MQTYNAVLLPYYRILDVDITANFDDIKKKYRELARLYHPDLNKSRHATELMQSINEAYRKIAAHFGG
ncbi:MAG: DnaJ domain-containing protein [Anaerolineae bacterium]|nr:MAG: DnaJ domain-containing protein [Anaerolineae bacterium]MCL4876027.1 DnaJ domain-containing protein [Anaerolineae bacterium]